MPTTLDCEQQGGRSAPLAVLDHGEEEIVNLLVRGKVTVEITLDHVAMDRATLGRPRCSAPMGTCALRTVAGASQRVVSGLGFRATPAHPPTRCAFALTAPDALLATQRESS